ncbi:MAG: hypothetical protein KBD76_07860 [Bacteriovorax sp.]|nr:hypothetical protein [Bacteriovorax sp.]
MLNKWLTLFFWSSTLCASDCTPARIKMINFQKEVITQEVICFLPPASNRNTYIVSESCVEKKCEILKREKKPIIINHYMKNFGSPGFKLCDALGGSPQIFEFQVNTDKYLSTERCLFGENDFVEIALLSHEWKHLIETTQKK